MRRLTRSIRATGRHRAAGLPRTHAPATPGGAHLPPAVRAAERGISSVVVALVAPCMIAGVGLSVDSGNLMVDKARVQKAADTTAMAIGQDCARATRPDATSAMKARCSASGAQATATLMTNGNVDGATVTGVSSLTPGQGTATIIVTKQVPMRLGSRIGIQPKTATARATVTWGQVPVAATTFPLALSTCDYYRWKASPNETRKLYRYDAYQGGLLGGIFADSCTNPSGGTSYSAKGGMWLVGMSAWFNNSSCNVSTTIGVSGVIASTNLLFPTSCANRVRALTKGQIVLLPIYDSPNFVGLVTQLFPTIRGYAPFKITGWRVGGSLNTGIVENQDSAAPACSYTVLFNNVCRGIQGYFVGSIAPLPEVDAYGIAPGADFGSVRVKLTS